MTNPVASPPQAPFAFSRTLPGRLFLLSTGLLLVLLVARQFVELPSFLQLFRSVVRLAWLVSVVWLSVLLVARNSRRLLWRVRQKLILSYVFLGFVPVILVALLAFVGALTLYLNVAAYMFYDGFTDIAGDVAQLSETTAADVSRSPGAAAEAIAREQAGAAARFPTLSMAVIDAGGGGAVIAGPWRHAPAPSTLPAWIRDSAGSFHGVVVVETPADGVESTLVMRSVVRTSNRGQVVVVDLPVDADVVTAIEAATKTRMGQVFVPGECGGASEANASAGGGGQALFRQTVAFVDCTSWATGEGGRASISLDAPVSRLFAHVVAQSRVPTGWIFAVFVLLGSFFLIIQGAALFFGALLARSITYAVHELATGTERVQQGDFTHRIRVQSDDQLGELGRSFNRMSASIEHGLHVQREKQRLEDELRIAREIQKSLLPTMPPVIAGMSVADLCEPAREVGGDYYDFFELGPRQLGVMIADVSGKGTSAALYMAELKGLMLSLAHRERSPRRLLIEANRLLSAHLDNRSFITMTYAVIDLEAGTLTCARAGHTPLIAVSESCREVVTPSGMVLGLRLPGAGERFAQVLEEHTRLLAGGDVFVLYTDGITEAMNEAGDLFSDESLAQVVADHQDLDAAGIRERVVREVNAFVGNAEPHDDMTLIVLKIGEPATPAPGP